MNDDDVTAGNGLNDEKDVNDDDREDDRDDNGENDVGDWIAKRESNVLIIFMQRVMSFNYEWIPR